MLLFCFKVLKIIWNRKFFSIDVYLPPLLPSDGDNIHLYLASSSYYFLLILAVASVHPPAVSEVPLRYSSVLVRPLDG